VYGDQRAADPSAYWNRLYRDNGNAWGEKVPPLTAFLAKTLAPGDIVLDLGCGTGRDCLHLGSLAIRSVGIDVSAVAIEEAERRVRALTAVPAAFRCGGIREHVQSCPTGAYDAVLSINALNHLGEEIEEIVGQVRRILKPGGHFVLSLFSSEDEEWSGHKELSEKSFAGDFGTVSLFDRKDMERLLSSFTVLLLSKEEYTDQPHAGAPRAHRNSFWRAIARKAP